MLRLILVASVTSLIAAWGTRAWLDKEAAKAVEYVKNTWGGTGIASGEKPSEAPLLKDDGKKYKLNNQKDGIEAVPAATS